MGANIEQLCNETYLDPNSRGTYKLEEKGDSLSAAEMDSRWKKATGVLKDVASIGFAKLKSPMAFIDEEVVKATEHNYSPPKEKHVVAALSATNSAPSRSRLKRVVEERLWRTKDWMVAVKTLALIHRLMRDANSCIFIEEEEEEIQHSSHATLLAITSQQFHDCSTPFASHCSLWVRKYSAYLDQRLRCSRIFNCNIESESFQQRTRYLDVDYIFISLPSLQQLLCCLLNCSLQGIRVVGNPLFQYALDLLVKESRNIYGTINHFIQKLVDCFMAGMLKYKVVRLINIYKRFYQQCDKLSEFYDNCRMLSPCDNIDLSHVVKLSESVLAKMENYVYSCADQTSSKESTARAEESPHTGDKGASQLVVPAVSTGEATEDRSLETRGVSDENVSPSAIPNSNTIMDFGAVNIIQHELDTHNDREIPILDSSRILASQSY